MVGNHPNVHGWKAHSYGVSAQMVSNTLFIKNVAAGYGERNPVAAMTVLL